MDRKIRVFETGAIRSDNTGRERFDFISPLALKELAQYLATTENSFAQVNYYKGIPEDACLESLLRHINDYQLNGKKILVWHAVPSNGLIVSAVLDGQTVLLLVPSNSPGVTMSDYPTFDGARAATVQFDGVQVPKENFIAQGAEAQALLSLALDFGIVALCAPACGAMAYLTDVTIQYLKTRKQFGQPLASFQVLQHRLGEMLIQTEMGLSMTYVATIALSEQDTAKRSRLVSMAKIEVAAAARFVGESSVQSHGGMGVTDELEVGDYFKRLTYLDLLLGDTNFHLQRMQELETQEKE
jgi:alkylation response protein AidB-like acyl-CoA dehydrogenase